MSFMKKMRFKKKAYVPYDDNCFVKNITYNFLVD